MGRRLSAIRGRAVTAATELRTAAWARFGAIEAELSEAQQKAARLASDAATANTEAAAIEDAAIGREAAALAAGENRIGKATDEDRQAAALRRRGKAGQRAAETARAAIPAIEARLAEAKQRAVDATLTAFRADRDAAQAATLEALASLAVPLAQLVIADRERRELVGDRYRFDAIQNPPAELWSGEHAVNTLLSALPVRLRPDGIAETVAALADRLAVETLASLKGGAK